MMNLVITRFLYAIKRSGFLTFNHHQFKLPLVIVGHVDGAGRKREIDILGFKPSHDLKAGFLQPFLKVPVIGGMISCNHRNIQTPVVEAVKKDPGRKIFLHALVILQDFPDHVYGFFHLVRMRVIGDPDIG